MSVPRDGFFDFGDMLEMRCADDADADDLRRAADRVREQHPGLADRLENLAWTTDRLASKGAYDG